MTIDEIADVQSALDEVSRNVEMLLAKYKDDDQ